jgi:hypothetical protein
MSTNFIDHLLEGDHASRPAFGDVPEGTLYACSDHGLIYQSDGSSAWSTWATLGGDISSHTGDSSDAHDASAISVLDTAANFTGTDVEAVLAELQDNIDAGGGGGAPTVSELGTTTVGATAETPTLNRWYLKKITVPDDGIILSTALYVASADGAVATWVTGLWTDNGGVPHRWISGDTNATIGGVLLDSTSGADAIQPRWVYRARNAPVTATDYWIGFICTNTAASMRFYRDAGSDRYVAATQASGQDIGWVSTSDSTFDISIKALFMETA